MSKKLTTKEAMQALLDGKKVRAKHWDSGLYMYINSKEKLVDQCGELEVFTCECYYELYEEPKPKKKVWQWRAQRKSMSGTVENNFLVLDYLMTEEEAKTCTANFENVQKHAGPFEVEE